MKGVESHSHFDKQCQAVLFEGKEAEDMMLTTLSKRHQVSKTVSKDRFTLQNLRNVSNQTYERNVTHIQTI